MPASSQGLPTSLIRETGDPHFEHPIFTASTQGRCGECPANCSHPSTARCSNSVSLPITFTLTEAIGKNAADQDSLDLTTSLGVALRTTLLRGYLAVFVELDLGLFSASYSYKIFKWGGIELPDVPLWEAWGYTVSLSQLVDVIERQ